MNAPGPVITPSRRTAASSRRSWIALGVVGVALGAGLLVFEGLQTRRVRQSVSVYTELIAAANRHDLATARRLCSARYLRTHDLRIAAPGGLVGLPRNIHPNFQAWRQANHVWICPTNRVGPVYQFVAEDGAWRFDGPIGLLQPGGVVTPMSESPIGEDTDRFD